ncbi:Ganglioside-induced differentiation-associated protein 1 [Amphibalanus amphitrite]|uniref:Ganglioside-induced differentiation-associated protein 1 n=1 Tax=Amphibalanus amphitrite TaxID=1232801 RepID=A0A6A4VYJ9_AMPAM|nr:ganglioside-induced differentiation-associated protein 1-like [Amphibalanus amphitrite]KAF0299976.1 Ganglioside-induced differentiation-associated protein 1 [Amphibalanus amphitrite]
MNGNGTLKLYYHPLSFYSHRVLFTLLEKGLHFKPVVVDLMAAEQYQPEYLRLNPNGAVPTLQDGVKVFPDSSLIMEYLEDNFSGGKYPRLMPSDKSSEMYRKVQEFTEAFSSLNIPVFSYGTMHNEELRKNVRLPQLVLRARVQATSSMDNLQAVVDRAMSAVPEARPELEKKLEFFAGFTADIRNPERYGEAVRGVEVYLQRVEDELITHVGDRVNWWLCGPSFTLADIDLCVLLNRIWLLGLEERLVTRCRPHLTTYLRRAQQRKAFQRVAAVPLRLRALMAAERAATYLPLAIGVGAVLAAVFGVYSARRAS